MQLTASAELARKLELARDLMRHSHPGGELGPIVERALDLLIESLMQRRFGCKKASPKRTRDTAEPRTSADDTAERDTAEPRSSTLDSADVQIARRGGLERASTSPYLPRSTRRAVVERDGLSCSWMDEHGVRCGSRAWLEYDHQQPRAKGGGSEPHNLRLLCRQHNCFAAEQAYGRKHVEHTTAERRRARAPETPPAI